MHYYLKPRDRVPLLFNLLLHAGAPVAGCGELISQTLTAVLIKSAIIRTPVDYGAGEIEGWREQTAGEPIRQSGQKAFIDDLGWLTELFPHCTHHVCGCVPDHMCSRFSACLYNQLRLLYLGFQQADVWEQQHEMFCWYMLSFPTYVKNTGWSKACFFLQGIFSTRIFLSSKPKSCKLLTPNSIIQETTLNTDTLKPTILIDTEILVQFGSIAVRRNWIRYWSFGSAVRGACKSQLSSWVKKLLLIKMYRLLTLPNGCSSMEDHLLSTWQCDTITRLDAERLQQSTVCLLPLSHGVLRGIDILL